MAKKKKDRNPLIRLLAAVALFGFACMMLMVAWIGYGLPSLDDVKPLSLRPSITIEAADGTLIARYGGMKGDAVALKSLPAYVPHAVLAIEDRRFYSHPGIDILGLGRAMLANVQAGRWAQGGSTLTQQLAKNLFLSPDKTLRRKGQEALMALSIERHFTKDEILEAYLNRVYFGSGAYGIDAAARSYFGKRAQDLTLWESAVLAGLLKAPSRFSPQANPKLSAERAKTVIKAMEEAGYITTDMEKAAMKKPRVALASDGAGDLGRYFADWIVGQLDSFMAESSADIVVRTTFNPKLQILAEAKTAALLKSLKPEDKISQVALVTLAKDGGVLAMIGGRDYNDSQFNRATQAQRQPGSAFKPFVYLAAMEAGYTPDSNILDAPFIDGKYRPENYEKKYYGNVTLTQALAMSLNTATVRLLSDIGISRLLDVAKRAGFGKIRPELSSALGADETTLLTLANGYAMFANGGYGVWPYAVLSIKDGDGNLIYRREGAEFGQVFTTDDTSKVDQMMEQVVAQGTGQAAQLRRGHVAGKTGTTQNYRDAWFVGYTDRMVTGVWMGNDDDTSMNRVSGGRYPARLWHDYMNDAIDVPVPDFGAKSGGGGDAVDSFTRFLSQWSDGDFGTAAVTGSDKPVYNH